MERDDLTTVVADEREIARFADPDAALVWAHRRAVVTGESLTVRWQEGSPDYRYPQYVVVTGHASDLDARDAERRFAAKRAKALAADLAQLVEAADKLQNLTFHAGVTLAGVSDELQAARDRVYATINNPTALLRSDAPLWTADDDPFDAALAAD